MCCAGSWPRPAVVLERLPVHLGPVVILGEDRFQDLDTFRSGGVPAVIAVIAMMVVVIVVVVVVVVAVLGTVVVSVESAHLLTPFVT